MNTEHWRAITDLMAAAAPLFSILLGFSIGLAILQFIGSMLIRAFREYTEFEIDKPKRKAKDEYEPPDSLVDETGDGEVVYWDFEPENGKRKNDERD